VLVSLTMLLSMFIMLAGGELVVRLFAPQKSLYPRWEYSEHYGSKLYKNTTMVHEKPGNWRFEYTINGYGYRGREVPISNIYNRKNIVLLGDSHAFGTGVNDGDEYAAILDGNSEGLFDVVNLAVGGWGLLQEIRKYYEFGRLYEPEIVILQFASNDPRDNFKNRVTLVEGDRFRFVNSDFAVNYLKKYLSHSWIQKSQLYNYFRDTTYRFFERVHIEKSKQREEYRGMGANVEEELYNKALAAFARDLARNNVTLVMIAVNGSLERFPLIRNQVSALDNEGLLKYIEVSDWFTGMSEYSSPEGHQWGVKAHRIIGENLSRIVKDILEVNAERDGGKF